MRRQFGGDVDLAAAGRIDPDTARVEVELAADPAGEERLGPAIFGVADDRVAERRHMRAQLVGPAGQRLKLEPGGAVAGALDQAPAGLGRKPRFLVDVHLFAAGAGLLGQGRVDHPLFPRRHADDQCPIDLARGPAGKALGEMAGRSRRPRHQQGARRVLVEPVDELGSPAVTGEPVEQAIEVLGGLGPALRGEPRRLVEDEGVGVLEDHHVADELDLLLGQRIAPWSAAWGTAPARPRPAARGSPARPRSGRQAPRACR